MTTQAQSVKFRRQMEKLEASRRTPDNVKMPPRKLLSVRVETRETHYSTKAYPTGHLVGMECSLGPCRRCPWKRSGPARPPPRCGWDGAPGKANIPGPDSHTS
jgi:hypothetical protein